MAKSSSNKPLSSNRIAQNDVFEADFQKPKKDIEGLTCFELYRILKAQSMESYNFDNNPLYSTRRSYGNFSIHWKVIWSALPFISLLKRTQITIRMSFQIDAIEFKDIQVFLNCCTWKSLTEKTNFSICIFIKTKVKMRYD